MVGEELWQAQQVVCSAAEDEEPVDLGQTSPLHLGDGTGLLQPAEGLLDQPAAAQADRVSGVPGGSAIEVRTASFFVLLHMRAVTFSSRAPAMKSFVS